MVLALVLVVMMATLRFGMQMLGEAGETRLDFETVAAAVGGT